MANMDDWIRRQIESGYTPEQIKQSLRESGRDPELVDEFLEEERGPSRDQRTRILSASAMVFVVVVSLVLIFSLYVLPVQDVSSNGNANNREQVGVIREIESPVRPGAGPTVTLTFQGDYRGVEVREEIPDGLSVIEYGSLAIEETGGTLSGDGDEVIWNLENDMSEVKYRVGTSSTGTYQFSGTYIQDGEVKKIEGEKELEVTW